MSRWGFGVGIYLTLCLFAPAFAQEEIPVNIKADKLQYEEGSDIVVATGSVEVKLKKVTIYSDRLYMDSESNVATAEGNVKMVTEDYEAFSDYVVYDVDTEITHYNNFKTKLAPGKIKGNLFVQANEINDANGKMVGNWGAISTCDDSPSHYYVKAHRIAYYPKDKVIGTNATVYVGELPVLWLPYIVYPLGEKAKKNWVIGHNAVEGDYFKSTWDYPFGLLYLDLMQSKGLGSGIENSYNLLGLGVGTLFLYTLSEQDTGVTDWVTRINHTKQINPYTKLTLDHAYTSTYLVPSGRRDQTTFGLDLDYKNRDRWNLKFNTLDDRGAFLRKNSFSFNQADQKSATDYYFNYDYAKNSPRWLRASQRFYHRQPLWSDNVVLTTKANYYNSVADEGLPGDERLEPVIEIAGREKGFSWRLTENWFIDFDGNTYIGDEGQQFLEKLPEIEVSPDPIDLKIFTLRPIFGYGHYREVRYVPQLGTNRDYSTQRYRATLDINKSIPLAMGTTAVLNAGVDQFLYAPGDQLYAYRESLGLRTNLGSYFRNDIDYKKGISEGNTPFLFDQLGTRYHSIQEQMTFYYLSNFRWTIDGGYNWQTHKWFDVNTNWLLRPNQVVYWDTRTGWDIENTKWKDLVNSLNLLPYSYLSLNFSTVSDMNTGLLKSGSILYDVLFLEGQPNQWEFKFSQIYEPSTQQFKVRDIMIVKELHCWKLKYTYSDYRKEFSVSFSLDAMPNDPFGMSSGRGFYFDGFEKELKEFKQEGAVFHY
ncbi:hypothetical protein A3J44_06705 [candidate division WOR-1 bacterium RIFCSPHIGHO2_02_FULL_45_12]|uniref:Organic solvent tolerance-like N-terminal domain-containing protein n=1 Tax=candidate division WOR-1 bacterium RIFCSPLOWO2_12_FULL_45_9 TaxID=1802568 RepID=A0A1F4RNT7_UNCSA|nr:MAG: hypothetical protein A3J44_06705 [candidate division WOR-1 bacterium RIFCSPHIGHO2_02_FULL_45_12]OGC09837.1 MAG: hypothetical protein A3F86_04050 [candidate division WOR-1 bacterium RIFCSPLOWO2_12_FULL_45_9]